MVQCFKCNESLVAEKETLICSDCKNQFHVACTKIRTVEKFKSMTGSKRNQWKCEPCATETSSRSSDVEPSETKQILDSISAMRKEMCSKFQEVNESVGSVKSDLADVKMSIESLYSSLSELSKENEERRREHGELKLENEKLRDEVQGLHEKIADLEQYSRRNNIEVVGVPQTQGENIYRLLNQMATVLGVTFSRDEISVAHRLPAPRSRPDRHPNILIQFTSRTVKSEWISAAKRKGRSLTAATLSDSFQATSVFFNDHLTASNKAVLGRARDLVRAKKLVHAWTFDCKVLVRRTLDGPPTRVRSFQDLELLLTTGKATSA